MLSWYVRLGAALAVGFVGVVAFAGEGPQAEQAAGAEAPAEKKVDWVRGPATVDVGSRLAEVALPEGLMFARAEDAQRMLRAMGNLTSDSELGLVTSEREDEDWIVIFEWRPVGYVKDDEKDEIDADALLKSIQEGTEEANEEKKKQGMEGQALHVVGWAEPPHYDPATHNLTWAIRGRDDDGHEVINYEVRVLGREGVMAVTLVDDAARLGAAKPKVDQVIGAFRYKLGKTYAEWVPGDKVATYGLTALVAAGAGAAAVKTGFLAGLLKVLGKGLKVGAVAVVAVVAALGKLVKRLLGRKEPPAGPPPMSPPPAA